MPATTWNLGDRVRVLQGEHEGRTGTVSMLPSSPYATYMKISDGYVQVALDGEPGGIATGSGARAAGGRGGMPIVIGVDDLEPYAGPAGIVRSKGAQP